MFNVNFHIKTLLDDYLNAFPGEIYRYGLLMSQLKDDDDMSSRKNFRGHVTASAYILSSDKKEVAIIHNINLNIWLAPGGHWESGDNEMYNTAKREAIEESGIGDIELHNRHTINNFIPIDIDTHYIPENPRKQEKEHHHHDFRYIFTVNTLPGHVKLQLEEVQGFQWILVGDQLEGFSGNKVLKKITSII